MTQSPALISIASTDLTAQIDPLGAQLFTLRTQTGQDLLWDGDPAIWTGRAPILFPIVGALEQGRYRLGDEAFFLPKHGFARQSRFEVLTAAASAATFRLSASDATREVYPFEFQLDLEFSLEGASLTQTARVANHGDRPMPASFGFHPALRWPLPFGGARAEHRLRFAEDEPAPIRRINDQGVGRLAALPTPVQGRDLVLRDELFVDDAVIFDQIASRSLVYGAPGHPGLAVDFPDSPYLGVWTKPGAGYVCIEPWCGVADPAGYDGDFRDKPGVFEVAPGAERRISMSISLTSGVDGA